jgi:hypothetical protein
MVGKLARIPESQLKMQRLGRQIMAPKLRPKMILRGAAQNCVPPLKAPTTRPKMSKQMELRATRGFHGSCLFSSIVAMRSRGLLSKALRRVESCSGSVMRVTFSGSGGFL